MRETYWQPLKHYTFLLVKGVLLGFTISFFLLPHILLHFPVDITPRNEEIESNLSLVPGFHKHELAHRSVDARVLVALYNKVKVLCWVITQPKNHQNKAQHVKATWGKRCNILLFMSTKEDVSLPTVALHVKEGREYLRYKTSEALRYVYNHYLNEADWFLKADDDTYVIMENLRYMLSSHNPNEPIYFGCKFKPYVKQGYMSGGAGYVLSKEALRRFIEVALDKHKDCLLKEGSSSEDVFVGSCLYGVGVKTGNSRDSTGRHRFQPFMVETVLFSKSWPKWYSSYIADKPKEGLECCSDTGVSFHYVSPANLYALEYLIYHLRPFGIIYNYNALNNTII